MRLELRGLVAEILGSEADCPDAHNWRSSGTAVLWLLGLLVGLLVGLLAGCLVGWLGGLAGELAGRACYEEEGAMVPNSLVLRIMRWKLVKINTCSCWKKQITHGDRAELLAKLCCSSLMWAC